MTKGDKMQNLRQLQHFELVAQERSFARAAELANISQPALSNSIRSLERRLGLPLFERSERPIALTSAGRGILKQVEALLLEARNLDQLLENLETGQGGHIRIGMTAVFSTSLGGPIMAEWFASHPNVSLDLIVGETTDILEALRSDDLDLIVGDDRDLKSEEDDLQLIKLPPQPGGAFCRSGHPILDILRPLPEDLARYQFAGTHFPNAVIGAFARFLGRNLRSQQPIISINSHNIAALRDAVAESDLILLTTKATVRNALALEVLKQIPIDLGIFGTWSIATNRGRVYHPAIPSLINKIIETSKRESEHRLSSYAQQFNPPRTK